MSFWQRTARVFGSAGGAFLVGSLVGLVFFAAFYGLALVNPTATDWIWHGVTHDTTQHYLGWEFFRAGSEAAVITGLAFPVGLPLTFMDAIPLVALPLNLFGEVLPANFQYFGLWALICYVLQGAIAAVLVRKVWTKILAKDKDALSSGMAKGSSNKSVVTSSAAKQSRANTKSGLPRQTSLSGNDKSRATQNSSWRILFVATGASIFVLAPMMIARTLYHPALAAQWLVLLGILLVWDAAKLSKLWKFVVVWSAMLIGAVLIHPYFLPMLGAMMLVAALRNVNCHLGLDPESTSLQKDSGRIKVAKQVHNKNSKEYSTAIRTTKITLKFLAKIFVPVALAGLVFAAIGGFALGSGSEIHDLHEKGFNLLSFANPGGYSLIPGFANASSSPETMMWLGLGVWTMIIAAAVMWIGCYKQSFRNFRAVFAANKARNILITIVAVGLLIFAIGIRVDFGPITLFQYAVPDKVYEIWSAFRAAAREAWPFYYAGILAVIYWFARALELRFSSLKKNKNVTTKSKTKSKKNLGKKNFAMVLALAMLAISTIQFADIWFSDKAVDRRQGFAAARGTSPEINAPFISDLVTTQRNLIALDAAFRGDMSGFYKIGRTALQNNLTLNVGFFARVPDEIWTQQEAWREKILNNQLTDEDLAENIFMTRDEKLAELASQKYRVEQRGDFYFITAR